VRGKKLLDAYNALPVVGEVEGEQRAGVYTIALRWDESEASKVPMDAVSVGDDLITRVDVGDAHMLVLLKVIDVQSFSPMRSDAYVIGTLKTAPKYKVYAKVMPTMTIKISEEGMSVGGFATVLNPLTKVKRLRQEFIDAFVEVFDDRRMMIPGKMLGSDSETVLWLPHFGRGPNGIGEAYHIGVFGRTGSGKSAFTKQILAYMGGFKEPSAVVFDPQGEFARDVSGGGGVGTYPLDISAFWDGRVDILGVDKIRIESVEDIATLISAVGYPLLTRHMQISSAKTEDGSRTLARFWEDVVKAVRDLKEGKKKESTVLDEHPIFKNYIAVGSDGIGEGSLAGEIPKGSLKAKPFTLMAFALGFARYVLDNIGRFYSEQGVESKGKAITSLIERVKQGEEDKEYLSGIDVFWRILMGERSIEDSVKSVLTGKKMLIITMGDDNNIPEGVAYFVLSKLVDALLDAGRKAFSQHRLLNLLVVLDEAHRFAPAGRLEDTFAAELKDRLVRAVRETRKYGLGWLFVSQTLASLDKELVSQIRIFFVGYGLNHGSDRDKLSSMLSGYPGAMDVYMQFPDPFSSQFYGIRIFPFMAIGPASPLSASGFPIFFRTYDAAMFRDRNL